MYFHPSTWCLFVFGMIISSASGQNPTTSEGPTTTPEPPITWFECDEQYSYHPNPSNCTQYIICVFGKPYLRACEGGLHWNDRLKNCDWPNPKTTCLQVDDNTAYRPESSPAVTAPSFANEGDSMNGDNDWQIPSSGKYSGSQPLSRFKPDEDAARDQLSNFAGKKVVYFEAPADQQDQLAQQPSTNNQQSGSDSNSDRPTQVEQAREKLVRKKQEEVLPIGQMQQAGQSNGQPLRMSSWDTGNDEFPAHNQDSESQAPPKRPTQQRPMKAAPAQSNPLGSAPPWAAALLAKKNARPQVSSENLPPSQPMSWSDEGQSNNFQGQQPSANRNQEPQQPARNQNPENSFATPPPPTFAPRRPEPSRNQRPPPPRPTMSSMAPPQVAETSFGQGSDQDSRAPSRTSGFESAREQPSNIRGGYQGGRPKNNLDSEESFGNPSLDRNSDSMPSLRQPSGGSPSQKSNNAMPAQRGSQGPRQPQNRPAPQSDVDHERPNAFSFPSNDNAGAQEQDRVAPPPGDQGRRVNPSPFSPNAITNSFSRPAESRSPVRQQAGPRAPIQMAQAPPKPPVNNNMDDDFGSFSGQQGEAFPMRPQSNRNRGNEDDSRSSPQSQMNFATRRPSSQSQNGNQPQRSPPKSGIHLNNGNQFNGDVTGGGQDSFPGASNEDSWSGGQPARRGNAGRPPSQGSPKQMGRPQQPAANQHDGQDTDFGAADDTSVKEQLQQLSQRFPGFQDESGFGAQQDNMRTKMQFGSGSRGNQQQFPFENEDSNSGGGQRFPFEAAQDDIPSDFFPESAAPRAPQRQKNSRPLSMSGDHRDEDFASPSNYNEQRMRQFYAGI